MQKILGITLERKDNVENCLSLMKCILQTSPLRLLIEPTFGIKILYTTYQTIKYIYGLDTT